MMSQPVTTPMTCTCNELRHSLAGIASSYMHGMHAGPPWGHASMPNAYYAYMPYAPAPYHLPAAHMAPHYCPPWPQAPVAPPHFKEEPHAYVRVKQERRNQKRQIKQERTTQVAASLLDLCSPSPHQETEAATKAGGVATAGDASDRAKNAAVATKLGSAPGDATAGDACGHAKQANVAAGTAPPVAAAASAAVAAPRMGLTGTTHSSSATASTSWCACKHGVNRPAASNVAQVPTAADAPECDVHVAAVGAKAALPAGANAGHDGGSAGLCGVTVAQQGASAVDPISQQVASGITACALAVPAAPAAVAADNGSDNGSLAMVGSAVALAAAACADIGPILPADSKASAALNTVQQAAALPADISKLKAMGSRASKARSPLALVATANQMPNHCVSPKLGQPQLSGNSNKSKQRCSPRQPSIEVPPFRLSAAAANSSDCGERTPAVRVWRTLGTQDSESPANKRQRMVGSAPPVSCVPQTRK